MLRRFAIIVALVVVALLSNALLYRSSTGNDLYPRWYGSRELFLGRDPYGLETTREIERYRYGRPLTALEIRERRDQEAFAYPIHVAFVLAPLTAVGFSTARHVMWILLVSVTFLSFFVWADTMQWRPPWVVLVLLSSLILFSPICQRGLRLTQLALLVAFLLAASFWLVVRNRLFTAGLVLALATIKPQMALLPGLWLLLWAVGHWRERVRFILSFALSMAILLGAGLWVLPSWPWEFLVGLRAYANYTGAPSAVTAVLHYRAGKVLQWALLALAAALAVYQRRAPASGKKFALTAAAMLAATAWAMPAMFDPFNQVLMMPGVCLLGAWFQHRRNSSAPGKQDSRWLSAGAADR